MDVPYHDAKLRAIQVEENRDIVLSFTAADGSQFRCVLHGVKHFCCDNFREGNTVLDRRLADTPTVMIKDLSKLLFLTPDDDPSALSALSASINRGSLSFYKIVASYGASVLAVCASVEELPAAGPLS